jgi:hypothetical protein
MIRNIPGFKKNVNSFVKKIEKMRLVRGNFKESGIGFRGLRGFLPRRARTETTFLSPDYADFYPKARGGGEREGVVHRLHRFRRFY